MTEKSKENNVKNNGKNELILIPKCKRSIKTRIEYLLSPL